MVYPANYWLSLAELPKGKVTEQEVLSAIKECMTCHQVGDLATRTFPKNLGTFPTSLELWDHRVRVGVEGPRMSAMYNRVSDQRKMFADWTDRIAAGAYPKVAPPRPKGVERNLVVTLWDWATATGGRADAEATDERNPNVNANGLVWGAIQSDDILAWLDPSDEHGRQHHDSVERTEDRCPGRTLPLLGAPPTSGCGQPTRAAWRSISSDARGSP